MTAQEANVLLRCIEAGKTGPGKLSAALGREKGKITRFLQRLEAERLLTRVSDPRDRRLAIIKTTAKGKRIGRDLASAFDGIRSQLFIGILEEDISRLGRTLPQLRKNAVRLIRCP